MQQHAVIGCAHLHFVVNSKDTTRQAGPASCLQLPVCFRARAMQLPADLAEEGENDAE